MCRSVVIFFLLCCSLIGPTVGNEEAESEEGLGLDFDLNSIVDKIFELAKEQIVLQNLDELPIPDIHESFDKKVGPFQLKGTLTATQGFVNSLSSIQRTGDMGIDLDGRALTLTSHLGFGVLRVRYDDYRVQLFGSGPRGKISASVKSNSIRLSFRIEIRDDGCSVTLSEAKVVELGQFDVKITGLGSLDWLASRIVTAVTEKRREHIMAEIEKALTKSLAGALDKFKCDQYFSVIREELGKLGLS